MKPEKNHKKSQKSKRGGKAKKKMNLIQASSMPQWGTIKNRDDGADTSMGSARAVKIATATELGAGSWFSGAVQHQQLS
jgi:hypothetical protein